MNDRARDARVVELDRVPKSRLLSIWRAGAGRTHVWSAVPMERWSRDELLNQIVDHEFRGTKGDFTVTIVDNRVLLDTFARDYEHLHAARTGDAGEAAALTRVLNTVPLLAESVAQLTAERDELRVAVGAQAAKIVELRAAQIADAGQRERHDGSHEIADRLAAARDRAVRDARRDALAEAADAIGAARVLRHVPMTVERREGHLDAVRIVIGLRDSELTS